MKTLVFDFGGSIVAPNGVDIDFLSQFKMFLKNRLDINKDERAILVVGGGASARVYQQAYRDLYNAENNTISNNSLDRIGIAATHLNAELLHAFFFDFCKEPVVKNPSQPGNFSGRILIGAGWKPGFSSDYDAVLLAEHFGASVLMNLSNITQIYSADPKKDPNAKPYTDLTWSEYEKLAGDTWIPGSNLPFDPVATSRAKSIGLKVVTMNGRNLKNIGQFLAGESFVGTVIHPA